MNTLDGVNATLTAAELNILDGITATTAEINVLDGITATVDELNILDGVTVTAAQLNTPTLMTAKASTSGTVIDFTEIPTWVKRVTVMLIGVSTNGTSHPVVQIGAGSVVASGYASYDTVSGTSSETSYSSTVGFGVGGSVSANLVTAIMTLVNFSGTTWIASHCGGMFGSPNAFGACGGGWITLSGALDRVRVTTTNGTDAFDAGTINIMYE